MNVLAEGTLLLQREKDEKKDRIRIDVLRRPEERCVGSRFLKEAGDGIFTFDQKDHVQN